jgi:RNA polymerase sigma-70 factor, ECF subfamily
MATGSGSIRRNKTTTTLSHQESLPLCLRNLVAKKFINQLNLCSPRAFHLMTMPEVADIEQLPMPQARAGEPAAWDALFRRYQMPLYVYVFELVRDEQAGLDILQETFIAAARHIGGLRNDAKFGSWLFGIAHQKCIQHWRKRREIFFDEIPESPDEFEDSPHDLLIQREQETEFMNLLNRLLLPQRSVMLLHFVEEFSLEEIAQITETQLGTVKSRMHYAKKSLENYWRPKMKTPRDILFTRHQAAAPKLDAIRRKVGAELNHEDPKAQSGAGNLMSWCRSGSKQLWRELVWPCRRIWAGLAAVWILVFIVNVSQRDGLQTVIAKSSPPTEVMMTFRDQQKLLNELFADRSLPAEAEQPRIYLPKPRTQTMKLLTA